MAEVEQERAHLLSEADIQRILADLQSPDEQIRAKAVVEVCPCRVPWEVFRRLRKAVKPLQEDPSLIVRAHARHVEQDAREIESVEALAEQLSYDDDREHGTRQREPRAKRRERRTNSGTP